MAGLDFNGTGANTSKVQATQFALGTANCTVAALILPDSAGQSNVGRIFQTASGTTGRRSFYVGLAGADIVLGFTLARALTATSFLASNRKILPSASTSTPCFVATTFDDAATPKVKLYTTGDGTVNDADLALCTNGTATAGTGAVLGSDTVWTIGNTAAVAQTFDGGIVWVGVWQYVLDFNELLALSVGINPAMIGAATSERAVLLDDASSAMQDIMSPANLWTPTSVTARDLAFAGFAPGC